MHAPRGLGDCESYRLIPHLQRGALLVASFIPEALGLFMIILRDTTLSGLHMKHFKVASPIHSDTFHG